MQALDCQGVSHAHALCWPCWPARPCSLCKWVALACAAACSRLGAGRGGHCCCFCCCTLLAAASHGGLHVKHEGVVKGCAALAWRGRVPLPVRRGITCALCALVPKVGHCYAHEVASRDAEAGCCGGRLCAQGGSGWGRAEGGSSGRSLCSQHSRRGQGRGSSGHSHSRQRRGWLWRWQGRCCHLCRQGGSSGRWGWQKGGRGWQQGRLHWLCSLGALGQGCHVGGRHAAPGRDGRGGCCLRRQREGGARRGCLGGLIASGSSSCCRASTQLELAATHWAWRIQ